MALPNIRKENFIKRVVEKFGDTWEILSEYLSFRSEMKFKCKVCNTIYVQTPHTFLRKEKCKKCCYNSRFDDIRSFTEKARKIHGDQFDYSKVKYVGSKYKVILICNKHNKTFLQEPRNHLFGHGCSECKKEKLSKSHLKNRNDFVNLAISVHGSKYNYDKVHYINNNKEVEIYCNLCRKYFFQRPRLHISGHDCFDCSVRIRSEKLTATKEEFLEQAQIIYKNKYVYDLSNFKGNTKDKIKILCSNCNKWFAQKPSDHLSGNECPWCSGGSISKAEISWLDALNIPEHFRQKTILTFERTFKVDAFDPIKFIVYEFYGDFWHGNPQIFAPDKINCFSKKTFGELYQSTIDRQQELIKLGYQVIFIWESDFYEQYGKLR